MRARSVTTCLTAAVFALAELAVAARADDMEVAAADCQSAASRVVSKTGGELLSVSSGRDGGRTVCRITVLVHGSGQKRPRKMTVTVPQ
jgi:hypothetical protein